MLNNEAAKVMYAVGLATGFLTENATKAVEKTPLIGG
jgi:hypothetical protein